MYVRESTRKPQFIWRFEVGIVCVEVSYLLLRKFTEIERYVHVCTCRPFKMNKFNIRNTGYHVYGTVRNDVDPRTLTCNIRDRDSNLDL